MESSKKSHIFVLVFNKQTLMNKSVEHKTVSIFQKVLEDKRAIRKCIQEKGDIKKIAKERGIKFATPLSDI